MFNKRFFLMAVCIFLFLLSACGKGDNTEETPVPLNDPYYYAGGEGPVYDHSTENEAKLRLMYYGAEAETDPLAEIILRRFNLSIEIIPYPTSYEELIAVLSASGDLPDLFSMALTSARLDDLRGRKLIRGIPWGFAQNYELLWQVMIDQRMFFSYMQDENLENELHFFHIPRVHDRNLAYATEGARIFYHKDWCGILGYETPRTTAELYKLAGAFAAQYNPYKKDDSFLIGMAADKPSRFAYFFGISPEEWFFDEEEGGPVPGYYSYKMLEPLQYARQLYEEGIMVFHNNNINLTEAGILIADGGSPEAIERVLSPVAAVNRITTVDALENHVGILNPPWRAAWGSGGLNEGWLVRAGLSDNLLAYALSLFNYSLSETAREYARYGLPGITYTKNAANLFFYTDPDTFRAFDLHRLYPTSGFLQLITRDTAKNADLNIPSGIAPAVRNAWNASTLAYHSYARQPENTGIHPIGPDVFHMDYNAHFLAIITGNEPVEDMFEDFREECKKLGIEEISSQLMELAVYDG